MALNQGRILQIQGSVVDVVFEDDVPSIYEALVVTRDKGEKLILEVEKLLEGMKKAS